MTGDRVDRFVEKPPGDNGLINGGFFDLDPSVIDRVENDTTVWELGPLEGLAADGELIAYRHDGFWAAMDTLRDKNQLESLWASGQAPWRKWA
jgi:glucose-1-phosphate cytidylyltransferase